MIQRRLLPEDQRQLPELPPAQFDTLSELAHHMLLGPAERSRDRLLRDLPTVAAVWDRLQDDLAARTTTPVLVHGDVCPPNAYVSQGPAGPVVTAPRVRHHSGASIPASPSAWLMRPWSSSRRLSASASSQISPTIEASSLV